MVPSTLFTARREVDPYESHSLQVGTANNSQVVSAPEAADGVNQIYRTGYCQSWLLDHGYYWCGVMGLRSRARLPREDSRRIYYSAQFHAVARCVRVLWEGTAATSLGTVELSARSLDLQPNAGPPVEVVFYWRLAWPVRKDGKPLGR